ncbi:MAG TPA: CaiB/BaiF CoA-transferase family protein [Alphaproteobacteria bacterium]|nr:CaiB/BaiF CoA-transferase family protein [Alphaproteobacteria bacterium]
MARPLDGMLVLALEQAVAAPYASSRLADAGARVIKIERPEGDFARGYDRVVNGASAYFVWLNRGKESLVCDIKDEDDRALLHRILARADVFIQNLAPGAAARAGFDSAELRKRHPRLVTCDISGYGDDNDYRDMKAYDLLIQAEVGLASITGSPDSPGRVGVSVADIAAGMYAETAILEALLLRARTGAGAGLSVSLFSALADWMAVPLLYQDYGGAAPKRVGLNHPSIAPYGAYPCKDGAIVIAIQNEREWQRLASDVLGRPDMVADARFKDIVARVANRPALDAIMAAALGRWTRAEAAARLDAAGIAYGNLNGVAEFARHPALKRMAIGTPMGPVALPAPPVRWSDGSPAPRPVPALGAQSEAIRREFAA